MNLSKLICTLLLIHLLLFNLYAQQHLVDVDLITTEDGLSNLLTTAAYKSKKGFLWIGTRYGLNQFNGVDFKVFTKEKHGLYSDANIRHIIETDDGLIWLYHKYRYATDVMEIDLLSPETEKVIHFDEYFKGIAPFKVKNIHFCKVEDAQHRTWIATDDGHLYQYKDKIFTKVYTVPSPIHHLIIDENDNFTLVTAKTIFRLDASKNELERFKMKNFVYKIFSDNEHTLWIATSEDSSKNHKVFKKEKNKALLPLSFYKKGQNLNAISFPYRNKMGYWFANSREGNGIHIFDSSGHWLSNTNDLFGKNLSINALNVFEDAQNSWISSGVGLAKIAVTPNPFELVHSYERTNELSDARGIFKDKDLYFINRNPFYQDENTKVVQKLVNINAAFGIYKRDDLLWFGAYQKELCFELNLKTQSLTSYFNSKPIASNANYFFSLADTNRLLVATNKGLIYLDIKNKTTLPFTKYNTFSILDSIPVSFIYQNANGIWLATDKGIFLMNEKQGVIKHFDVLSKDLPTNKIRHIHEDKNGVFWLSTVGDGIIKWHPSLDQSTSTFRQYTTQDGLSNNYIYAIYSDADGNLWASSDKGIMKIEPNDFHVLTFLLENGLKHNEFNFASHFQADDGTIYFGGLGGIVCFHPKNIKNKAASMPLIFTGYSILEQNKEELTDRFDELKKDNTIRVKPSDKFLEIRFSLMDFEAADMHQYKYKIEGYNDNWTFTTQNFIRITNLPYGKYTLKIQGQNIHQGWSDQELSLEIFVIKPYYLQWWFIVMSLLLSAGVTIGIIRWRINTIKKDKWKLEKEVQLRTETIRQQTEELKVLDQAKTRFFSNITHEFRTPLTLILGPLEQIIHEKPSESQLYPKLRQIRKNAEQLLGLINQLLDISKIEAGNMKIEWSHGDIIEHTQQLVNQIRPLVVNKQQILKFETSIEHWDVNYDKKKWTKIIFNLLSNAVKFTPQKGEIKVVVKDLIEENSCIQIQVIDNGIGIESEKLPNIFNRFYQTDDSHTRLQEGTGIGLALVKELIELQNGSIEVISEFGRGTAFTVKIPLLEDRDILENEYDSSPVLNPIQSTENIERPTDTIVNEEKLQVLLIEDNTELRAYIKSCLDETIYQITEASNGKEGLDKALAIIPDLIISDVMMPIKDGFEVTETIRQTVSTSHIPVVLLTAKSALESRLEGLQRGADAYLTKPFSPKELVIRIKKLIELRQLMQQRFINTQFEEEKETQFATEDHFIKQFKMHTLEHLVEGQLDNDELAKMFLMSRMQLHRKIKALTNLSTGQFVRTIRMEKAKDLLKSGQLNISEVAYETGFSSSTHFSKAFKKYFGMSPSEI